MEKRRKREERPGRPAADPATPAHATTFPSFWSQAETAEHPGEYYLPTPTGRVKCLRCGKKRPELGGQCEPDCHVHKERRTPGPRAGSPSPDDALAASLRRLAPRAHLQQARLSSEPPDEAARLARLKRGAARLRAEPVPPFVPALQGLQVMSAAMRAAASSPHTQLSPTLSWDAEAAPASS